MEHRVLDRKGLKIGIKNGFGFTDFKEKYGLGEAELRDAVAILYKNNKKDACNLVKQIEGNEKKRVKPTTKPAEYKGVPIEEFVNMPMDEFMKIENDIAVNVKADIPETVILEDEIHQLEDEVIKCESQRKQWLGQYHDSIKQMSKYEEELTTLREKMVRLKEKYNASLERNTKIVNKANEILEKKTGLEVVLEEKRQKLEKLKRIVLCAYADGTVSTMDTSCQVSLDDSGSDALYLELVARDECQDLRAREIKSLAKLLKIIENSELDFEIVYDNAEMEAVFSALKQARA